MVCNTPLIIEESKLVNRNRLLQIIKITILPISLSTLYFLFIFAFIPFQEVITFSIDEGFEIEKALLVFKGFPLYSMVSSDQPPLFTYILLFVIKIFGIKIVPARLLVLLFSIILVFSCCYFLQQSWSRLSAVVFVPLVLLIPQFIPNSVMVRQGIPGLSMAMLSFPLLLMWHGAAGSQRKYFFVFLLGLALTISVSIKLVTIYFLPVIMIALFVHDYLNSKQKTISPDLIKPSVIFGLTFLVLFGLALLILVTPNNLTSLFSSHLTAGSSSIYSSERYSIDDKIPGVLPLIGLGALGLIVTIRSKRWIFLYPAALSFVPYVLFRFHSPIWTNYLNYILIPCMLLASIAITEVIEFLKGTIKREILISNRSVIQIICILFTVVVYFQFAPQLSSQMRSNPKFSDFHFDGTKDQKAVLKKMDRYRNKTNWIVTDNPTYAVHIERPVPPNLATFSKKRITGESTSDEDFLLGIEEYHPEQILLTNNISGQLKIQVANLINNNYTIVLENSGFSLFIRNDVYGD